MKHKDSGEWVRLYLKEGLGCADIGIRFHVSANVVARTLKEAGVVIRGPDYSKTDRFKHTEARRAQERAKVKPPTR